MRNIFSALLIIFGISVNAQSIQRVHQSNGTVLQLPLSTIDSITYSTNAQSQTTMRIHQSNGTVLQLPVNTIDSITYLSINPGNLASISTLSISNITGNSASSGGNITSDGGSPVTHRGICWATTTNPTTANNVVNAGSGSGTFTINLVGLTPNTTYYVRAYATNTAGTIYGNQLSFTTSASSGGGASSQFNNSMTYGTVTDIDGNVYKTIQIGSQIWMAENLRVTKFRDGSGIPNLTDNVQWQNNTTGAWSYYNQNAINNLTYGKLYNWHAVKNTSKICPTGWHMPKDEEWTLLETTLGGNSVAGGKMKSTGITFWNTPNADAANSSGFSALPAGSRTNTGEFLNAREYGLWWSISDFTTGGWTRFTDFISGNISRDQFNKNYGLSVRCVFGDSATIVTNTFSQIKGTSATGGGSITSDGGNSITARGLVWSTSPNPTISLPTKTNDGTGSGSFTSLIDGLTPNTTYYVRAYATNIVGTVYGTQVTIITATIPTIETRLSSILATSAVGGGNITSDGRDPVTARGVIWSTSPNPTIDLSTKTNDGTGIGTFTSNISGLTLNTTYYLRAYAINSVGTAYGVQVIFKTDNISTLTTAAVSSILNTSAVCGGNISNDGGDPVTARGVVWSTSPNPTIDLPTKTNNGTGAGSFTSNITGLSQGTTYYVRAYAINTVGTAYGNQLSFTTDSMPTLTTNAISSISSYSAISGGNITSDGGDPITARGVVWSTIPNPTIDLATKTINGSGRGFFSSTISGLSPVTTYYVRSYATNSVGTAYGNELTFSTPIALPSLSTISIDAITFSTANSGGNITNDGGASVTNRGIVWSTSANPTISLQTKTTDGFGTGSYVSTISGLTSNTIYYVRAYATNSVGTAYGNEITFKTDNIPTLTTSVASSILGTSAVSGGNISDDGGDTVIVRGVVWSTSPNPNINLTTKTTNGTGIGSFVSNLSGLSLGTAYYIRAYATNNVGTGYGNEVRFTTDNIPTLSTVNASSVTTNSAISGGIITNTSGSVYSVRTWGLVWSTIPNPTIDLATKTINVTGSSNFSNTISGLSPGTTYYVRAYATNNVGTGYGNEINFRTLAILPSLTTMMPDSITDNSAVGGGNITFDGGGFITSRGVVWSINPNPTINLSTKTISGSGLGSFSSNITGLSPAITYYVRAYAINSAGIAYGNEVKFKSLAKVPSITTTTINTITANSAVGGGIINSDGGDSIKVRGIVWSTSPNPNINLDTKTNNGAGSGTFISNMSGLSINTTYYVRAYASNNIGTGYGNEINFTTDNIPTITTTVASNILITTAICGGTITSDGGDSVTASGVVWSTSPNPTIDLPSKTNDANGTGIFKSTISNLNPNTLYYVRAYASNSLGTAYGNQFSFTTLPNPMDASGNIYPTITIGTQIWMAENLRTTKFNDGTDIPVVSNNTVWANNLHNTLPMMCWIKNDEVTFTANKFGALYNQYATGLGLCPNGWHVPTKQDWDILGPTDGNGSLIAGGRLKSTGTQYWLSPNYGATNSSGWSGLPGGVRSTSGSGVETLYGQYGAWWSSELASYANGVGRLMDYNSSSLTYFTIGRSSGLSVRCIRD